MSYYAVETIAKLPKNPKHEGKVVDTSTISPATHGGIYMNQVVQESAEVLGHS